MTDCTLRILCRFSPHSYPCSSRDSSELLMPCSCPLPSTPLKLMSPCNYTFSFLLWSFLRVNIILLQTTIPSSLDHFCSGIILLAEISTFLLTSDFTRQPEWTLEPKSLLGVKTDLDIHACAADSFPYLASQYLLHSRAWLPRGSKRCRIPLQAWLILYLCFL